MRSCSECRRWEGNLSQEKSLKRRFHFFRLLIGNFTNKLGIPRRFAENFLKGGRHVKALLRGPSGDVWKVQLKKKSGGFFFTKGWKEFVEDHHLNEGDFLMFRYNGSLRFTVLIFNRTACQSEDAKFAKNTRKASKHVEESSDDDSVQIISQIPGAGKNPSIQRHVKYTSTETAEVSSQYKEETIRGDLAKADSQSYEGDKEEGSSQHKKERIREDQTASQPCEGDKEESSSQHNEETIRKGSVEIVSQPHEGDKETSIHSEFFMQQLHTRDQVDSPKQRSFYFLPSRRIVTRAEKAVVLNAANSFSSCCPFCIIVMKPYSVSSPYEMHIPEGFAEEHLTHRKYSTVVLRNATGGEWIVSFYRKSRMLTFTEGWRVFVHGNNVMEGDVCIFELLTGQNDFVLNVIIYRVADEVILLGVAHELET